MTYVKNLAIAFGENERPHVETAMNMLLEKVAVSVALHLAETRARQEDIRAVRDLILQFRSQA